MDSWRIHSSNDNTFLCVHLHWYFLSLTWVKLLWWCYTTKWKEAPTPNIFNYLWLICGKNSMHICFVHNSQKISFTCGMQLRNFPSCYSYIAYIIYLLLACMLNVKINKKGFLLCEICWSLRKAIHIIWISHTYIHINTFLEYALT